MEEKDRRGSGSAQRHQPTPVVRTGSQALQLPRQHPEHAVATPATPPPSRPRPRGDQGLDQIQPSGRGRLGRSADGPPHAPLPSGQELWPGPARAARAGISGPLGEPTEGWGRGAKGPRRPDPPAAETAGPSAALPPLTATCPSRSVQHVPARDPVPPSQLRAARSHSGLPARAVSGRTMPQGRRGSRLRVPREGQAYKGPQRPSRESPSSHRRSEATDTDAGSWGRGWTGRSEGSGAAMGRCVTYVEPRQQPGMPRCRWRVYLPPCSGLASTVSGQCGCTTP